MTQTAHVADRIAVYQILRKAVRLSLELPPKTLRSGAALLYERICESLIPLQKAEQLQRCRIALDTDNTLCAEHAGARHRVPDFTPRGRHFRVSRARASFTSPPRALGVYGCVRIWVCPRRPWKGTSICPIDAGHGKQDSLISEGKGEPFSSAGIQRLPGSQRMFNKSPGSMGNDYRIPPSESHRETPEPWFWYDTTVSLGTRQFPSTRRGGGR